jgi:hypothetical protein
MRVRLVGSVSAGGLCAGKKRRSQVPQTFAMAGLSSHHWGLRQAGVVRKVTGSPTTLVEADRSAHSKNARCSSPAWQDVARRTDSQLGVARPERDKAGTS